MRKDVHGVVKEQLYETLTLLGYRKAREDLSQWRRQRFHLIIRIKKHKLVLHLHEDLPSFYPPFHRARYVGKAVTEETHKILDAYKKRRLAKT